MRRSSRRVFAAAFVMALLVVGLLGAWFATGWHDVRAEQTRLMNAPVTTAAARAGELARGMREQLAQLIDREAARPYFHYQNLFHDPRASAGTSVTPSPLATGSSEPLIAGYFQVDADGVVTLPTINDQFPELSDKLHLAQQSELRTLVAHELAKKLTPDRAPLVAIETESITIPGTAPPTVDVGSGSGARTKGGPDSVGIESATVENTYVTIDYGSYAQNANSNAVYGQNNPKNAPPKRDELRGYPGSDEGAPSTANVGTPGELRGYPTNPGEKPKPAGTGSDSPTKPGANSGGTGSTKPGPGTNSPDSGELHGYPGAGENPKPAPPKPAPAPKPKPIVIKRVKPRQVTISISPLEWKQLGFTRGLVAARAVQTPDGNFTQGFVVPRAALEKWLASHAGDVTAELHADAGGAEVLPNLSITTAPNAAELATATADANDVSAAFIQRFVIVGMFALIAAILVVTLVARAERYARERSQFAAAAAHELRTPLAGMQLYGDMLADGLGDPAKLRDYARRMSEEAARLGRVVSNVLGFSQLERGNLSIDAKRGDVAPVLRAIVETAQPTLDREGVVVDLSCPESLEAKFDRDALTRIVGNLLDNAEKYSRGADDRTIHLEASRVDGKIEVRVRDHGAGVADPAKLFAAFSRGVSTDGPAGLGLGLALSRSLARAMSGDLEYRAGEGATFVLVLPT
ncbi:MAG: ATP-binding protein [Kofleriaceae bacterium]